jgi:dTDP-4-amino-4,6-dideoxygalactose transaminase
MSDIHAALGVSQIKKLNQFVTKRQFLAERYNKLLSSLPIKLPHQSADSYSSYHLYIIRLNTKDIKKSHRQIFKEIYSKGILVNLHYIPIYRHPFYKSMGFELNNFPEAESYFSQAISIPIYPAMTTSDQDRVIEVLHQVIN